MCNGASNFVCTFTYKRCTMFLGVLRMNIVLLGKPGAGKGYVSSFLQTKYGFNHISTGDICRKNVKEKTEYGKIVEEYCSKGQLVPLNIILDMLKNELKNKAEVGYILDGFPRNINQAEELNNIVNVDAVIMVDVPDEKILERIAKRRICPNCHKMFSTEQAKDNTCLACGSKLEIRPDDDLAVAKNRLDIYEKETKPLIEYYSDKLITIDNSGDSEYTFAQITKALNGKIEKKGENV